MGSSRAVPLLLAFVLQTCEFFICPPFLKFLFWRLLGDLPFGRFNFSFRLPLATGAAAVRVLESSAHCGSRWVCYRFACSVAGAFYYSCTTLMALVVWCCCGSSNRCFPTTTTTTTTTTNPSLSSSGPTGAGMGLHYTTAFTT